MDNIRLGDYWHCLECGTPTKRGKLKCDKCTIVSQDKEMERLKKEKDWWKEKVKKQKLLYCGKIRAEHIMKSYDREMQQALKEE